MKLIKETVKYEYESKLERKGHIEEMKVNDWYITKQNVELKLDGTEHIVAYYEKEYEGYTGNHITNGSIK